MEKCKACQTEKVEWNSICPNCKYYQHSCLSGKTYMYLKIPGNAEKLYSNIIDKIVGE